MDIVGLGFGVIAESRTVTQSIVRRVESCRQGRASFESLSDSLAHLAQNIEEVDRLTGKFPNALPLDVTTLFNSHVESRP